MTSTLHTLPQATEPKAANMPVTAVLAFNDGYCTHAAVTLLSILQHVSAHREYRICIIDDAQAPLSAFNRRRLGALGLPDNVSLTFMPFDLGQSSGQRLSISDWLGVRHIYFKLYLHRLLNDARRIMWLDADLLIAADIAGIFDLDLQGRPLGAVRDACTSAGAEYLTCGPSAGIIQNNPYFAGYSNLYHYFQEYLAFSDADLRDYFNVGVLIMDVPAITPLLEEGLSSVMTRPFFYPEQDVLNLLLKDQVTLLDEEYNCHSLEADKFVARCGRLPAVSHFYGQGKPDRRMHGAAFEEYWHCLSQTPYYPAALEKFINSGLNSQSIKLAANLAMLRRKTT